MSVPRRAYHLLYLSIIATLIWLHSQRAARDVSPAHIAVQDPLFESIRVLCLVIYDYKQPVAAKYIKRTWGQHCNVLLFVAGQLDAELEPFVPLENCTDKSLLAREGLNYAYEYYKDDADWFLRIDDFSFVAMENLRYMLAKHKPKQALYMGYELREPLNKQAFNYWRCGYVLSWEALRRFQAESKYCGQRWEQRLKLSRCLRQAGVATASSTDELGYETFIPIASFELFLEDKHLDGHAAQGSPLAISKRASVFSLAQDTAIYDLYYLTYHVHVFDKVINNAALP